MKYLWQNLDKITSFKERPIKVLILDFDGTLTPIAKSPNEAKLSVKTRNLLQKISTKKDIYLAIISGRRLSDIKEKIKLPNIIYGGNHGLEGEIFGKNYSYPITKKTLSTLSMIKAQLSHIANEFNDVFIEDKGLVLSFHYRLAGKYISSVKVLFKKTLEPYIKNGLISVITGKMVFDIRPINDSNKGTFARLLINKICTKTKITPAVIFIGDDITDEDVFRKLENKITVKVGKDNESSAKYLLKDTKDVFKFLEWVSVNF